MDSTKFLRRKSLSHGRLWSKVLQGEVGMKTAELSVYPGSPSVSSEMLLSPDSSDCQYCYCYLGSNSCLKARGRGLRGRLEEGWSSLLGWRLQLRAGLFHPASGSSMGKEVLPGLGSALHGCMTLSKSFWLVLSLHRSHLPSIYWWLLSLYPYTKPPSWARAVLLGGPGSPPENTKLDIA